MRDVNSVNGFVEVEVEDVEVGADVGVVLGLVDEEVLVEF